MKTFHFDWLDVPKKANAQNASRHKAFNEQLAERIRTYWARHGFDVTVDVVLMQGGNYDSYKLSSNLRNGLPAGAVVGGTHVPV